MRITSIALCTGLLLAGIAGVQAATIYKWTDEQGQTHFGSQPPVGLDSERLTTRSLAIPAAARPTTGQAAAPDESNSQKEIDARVKKQIAREQAELKEYCMDMRTRLSQLKNNPRLLAEVDGQTVRLSEEERQSRISETESKISEFCSTP